MTAVLEPTAVKVAELQASDLYRALSVASHFASTDRTIPMLCQVRLEGDGKGKLIAMATDRYVAGTVTVAYTGPAFVTGIDLVDLKPLLPLIKRLFTTYRNADVTLKMVGDNRLSVSFYDHEQTIRTPDDDYPKLLSLIPEVRPDAEPSVAAMAFNPAKLALFAKAVGSRTEPIRIHFTSPLKPARIEASDDFVGIIMPMRMEAR